MDGWDTPAAPPQGFPTQQQQYHNQGYGGGGGANNGWSQSPRRGGYRGGYRGGGGGGGGGYHHQQQSREQREESRLRYIRNQLFKLGEEKDFHPPSDLLKMARWVEEKAKEQGTEEPIKAAFRIMVTEQPHKSALIAALIGFLCLSNQSNPDSSNNKNRNRDNDLQLEDQDSMQQDDLEAPSQESDSLGIKIVKDLVKAFRSYLDARLWRNTRLSLHLFAALVPLKIVSARSLRNLLLCFAAVLEEPGVSAARGDRASLCIIETLCRAGQDLLSDDDEGAEHAQAQAELDSLVEKVISYDSARKVELELAKPVQDSDENMLIWLEGFEEKVKALEALRLSGYRRPAFLPSPIDLLPSAISPSATTVPEDKRTVSLPDVLVPPDEDEEDEGGINVAAYAQVGEQHQISKKRKVDTGKGELEERKAATGPERISPQPRWFANNSVPKTASPSSVVLRAVLSDMIDLYEVNRKQAANIVLELPNWFRRGTFSGKGVSPDQGLFGEADEEEWWIVGQDSDDVVAEGGWSLDDLIVETILSTSMELPLAPRNPLYYTSLLREIVCLTPGTVAPSLGRTIRTFYTTLGTGKMDVEVINRFADWFAIHLSNFNFGWAWKEWVADVGLAGSNHPKKSFMKRIVELEIRLSYYDRVKQTLPQEIQDFALPPQEPLPVFTYEGPSHPYYQQAARLIQSIKAKTSSEVILADFESFKQSILASRNSNTISDLLTSNVDAEENDQNMDPNAMKQAGMVNTPQEAEMVVRDIVIQCVLQVGSRSFSHFLNIVERYHSLLRQLSQTSKMRRTILASSTRFWRNNFQWIQIVVDKLLQYRIVEPWDVVELIFHPTGDQKGEEQEPKIILQSNSGGGADAQGVVAEERDWSTFNWFYLLRQTVEKVNGRVDQLRKRLDQIMKQEAEELERKEAAAVAGIPTNEDADADAETAAADEGGKLPLFPTSATLPSKPPVAAGADLPSAATGGAPTGGLAALSSSEAKQNLESIKAEQRKVLIISIAGFQKLWEQYTRVQRQLEAQVEQKEQGQELEQQMEQVKWSIWWVQGWFKQFVRYFNKQCAENRQLISSNCFLTTGTDTATGGADGDTNGPLQELFERAIDMISE